MKLKLLSCEVLYREASLAIARSPHQVDIEFLPKGLHDIGKEGMLQRLEEALEKVDESKYDAILFGYGMCNYGTVGLKARTIPIVLPRAHDCMTMFLGSKERYVNYFNENPGTYFLTTGWIERGENPGELSQLSIQHQNGMDMTYQELVEKYGEDNAQYLYDTLVDQRKHYKQLTFIEMGLEPDNHFEDYARNMAEEHSWNYKKVKGDMSLIEKLVNGIWDDKEFMVVQPGYRIVMSYDDQLIDVEKVD